MSTRLPEALRSAIAKAFPPDFLSDDPQDLREYGRDWTRVWEPSPAAVAFPRSTAEVAKLVRLCAEARFPIVPSGGRTGLSGGAMAVRDELVLSLSRMRRMDAVDPFGMTVRVEAGAVTEAVHRHCEPHGLTWPVDFASKGSSQVGGNIATNAGGVKVIRYGQTRHWVLGLQVVTASGDVLELNGALEKNNTGPDLRQLFIGSEGTLGIITEAVLKLTRRPRRLDVLLLALEDMDAVLEAFRFVRRAPFTLSAYEFFTEACAERVRRHRGLHNPLDSTSPAYVLLELEDAAQDALVSWVGDLLEVPGVVDGTLAQNQSQAAALWELRESISESLSATGLPHKNDVALAVADIPAFSRELESLFQELYPGWEVCLFGHVGDGNIHINVMKPEDLSKSAFHEQTQQADRAVFSLVQKYAGSISAEHGIGLLKKPFLDFSRSREEQALMRALKHAMDPHNVLNPGKVIDA